MSETHEPRPGTWQRVRTDSGWHLRLVGAQGEPVLVSETYSDYRGPFKALGVVLRSLGKVEVKDGAPSVSIEDIDERDLGEH